MNWNIFQLHSLKTRVTLFTLAIFLASNWSLAYFANVMLHKDMERQLGEQQLSIVSAIASDINHHLSDRIAALETVAQSMAQTMQQNPADMQALIERGPILPTLFNAGVYITDSGGTAIASLPVSVGRVGLNFMDQAHVAAALQEGKSSV